jgi:hypothetical protein
MARSNQFLHNGGTDKTRSSGNEDTHDDFLLF